MAFIIRQLHIRKMIAKIAWCLQNFLTMEFYRKICNKCYWSNINNPHHSFFKQSLIIFVSFISMLFFSFFYLPTDPANLSKPSYMIRLRNLLIDLGNILANFIITTQDRINCIVYSFSFLLFPRQSELALAKTSLRI